MPGEMLAIVFVRDGVIPAGGEEVAAEVVAGSAGQVLVCGTGAAEAASELAARPFTGEVLWLSSDSEGFRPGELAAHLSVVPEVVAASVVLLPGSPDGRDLAPRLAHALQRPLLAGAIRVTDRQAWVARSGGREIHEVAIDHGCVATLIPGSRGVEGDTTTDTTTDATTGAETPASATIRATVTNGAVTNSTVTNSASIDCEVTEVLGPDVTTMDLTEAPRIMGGGAGLDSPERFEHLTEIATALGASVGATRVITDRGWLPHQRQIGTTGCVINPDLYLAFGISGAVQHTAGLGQPEHIVSVNTDPHCPMMQLADLAIVSDANLVVEELRSRLVNGAGVSGDGQRGAA